QEAMKRVTVMKTNHKHTQYLTFAASMVAPCCFWHYAPQRRLSTGGSPTAMARSPSRDTSAPAQKLRFRARSIAGWLPASAVSRKDTRTETWRHQYENQHQIPTFRRVSDRGDKQFRPGVRNPPTPRRPYLRWLAAAAVAPGFARGGASAIQLHGQGRQHHH